MDKFTGFPPIVEPAPEFKPWPKIARLNRDIVITEKIDGTNAAIGVTPDGEVYAQSRTRIITPEKDNFGFARWVRDNKTELREALGPGLHFGEWYGQGIQRGYGLDHKRFALFNVKRFGEVAQYLAGDGRGLVPAGLDVVPVLYEGPFNEGYDISPWEDVMFFLRRDGSRVVPGFMKPEGIVIFHAAAGTMFKVTLEGDEKPKGQVE
jgi:hypothetical protein